jgi:hypothetical protein
MAMVRSHVEGSVSVAFPAEQEGAGAALSSLSHVFRQLAAQLPPHRPPPLLFVIVLYYWGLGNNNNNTYLCYLLQLSVLFFSLYHKANLKNERSN